MNEIENGGPAFPHVLRNEYDSATRGMTLLEYFAAHTDVLCMPIGDHVLEMRAERGTYSGDEPSVDEIAEAIADLKFKVARAMLRAREK